MAAVARAGWTLSTVFFLVIAASVLHADYVGVIPVLLLLCLAAICAWRPLSGIEIASALIPVSGSVIEHYRFNWNVSWPEVFACAALAGLSADAAWRPRARRVPMALAVPALLFGLVVASAIAASLGVKSLLEGPAFWSGLFEQLTRAYFVDVQGFAGLHAGLLLLEGVLFAALAARITAGRPQALRRVVGAAAIGAALAAGTNIARLLQSALRSDTFWSALARLSHTLRWNVEYADFNAAGSYFVMALFLGAAMLVPLAARRRWWITQIVLTGIALWLTGSRAAYVAGFLACGAALFIRFTAGRHRFVAAGALAVAVVLGIAIVALAAPRRGNQGSSGAAVDIRLQMALAGGRMIETQPAFGIGLAEFYQRSGEFISPELLAEFPVSLHENAHNNFVQIAAELGLLGGVTFVWLVGAGLFVIARTARRVLAADPIPLVIFAALLSFVVTWLAGHPLLIPEASYAFWIVLGAAAGATAIPQIQRARNWMWWTAAIGVVIVAVSAPVHVATAMDDAELEHVGVGFSQGWRFAPDGIRYRPAQGHATIFVPAASAFTFSVNPRVDRPVRLELRIDGRLANVYSLAPGRWNDLTVPARSERRAGRSRYAPLDLRILDGDKDEIWVTKVRPLDGR